MKRGFIFCFILQYSIALQNNSKNKADYFVDFTYRGLFLERILCDKWWFTVFLNSEQKWALCSSKLT